MLKAFKPIESLIFCAQFVCACSLLSWISHGDIQCAVSAENLDESRTASTSDISRAVWSRGAHLKGPFKIEQLFLILAERMNKNFVLMDKVPGEFDIISSNTIYELHSVVANTVFQRVLRDFELTTVREGNVTKIYTGKPFPFGVSHDQKEYSGKRIDVDWNNTSLSHAFAELEQAAQREFLSKGELSSDAKVTLRLKQVPWDQCLNIVLERLGAESTQSDEIIWIRKKLPKEEKSPSSVRLPSGIKSSDGSKIYRFWRSLGSVSLRNYIRVFAELANLNLVMIDDISKEPFYDSGKYPLAHAPTIADLEKILLSNGLTQRTDGNIVKIYKNTNPFLKRGPRQVKYHGDIFSFNFKYIELSVTLSAMEEAGRVRLEGKDKLLLGMKVDLQLIDVPWDQALDILLEKAGAISEFKKQNIYIQKVTWPTQLPE